MQTLKVLSLFSGIGAFEKALDRLGVEYELEGYCEIDRYAAKGYSLIHNTEEWMNFKDVTKIDEKKLPKDIDLLTYGFPCQDISLAGNQKGLVDEHGNKTRSGLVWDATRIIKEAQPKIAIAENVKNLVSKKFKTEFEAILKELEECGYNNYWKVLNAKEHGIAQNRERVFIVSIRKDIDLGLFEWPEKETLTNRLLDYLEDEVDEKYFLSDKQVKKIQDSTFTQAAKRIHDPNGVVGTLCARDYKDPKCVDLSLIQVGQLYGTEKEPNPQAGRIYDPNGISPTLDLMQGGNRMPKIVIPEQTDTTICINSKVDGKQPSVQDRIYSAEGVATAITTAYRPFILIPEKTKKGYALAEEGDGVYIDRPHQKRGVVQKGIIQTIKTSGNDVGVVVCGGAIRNRPDENGVNQPNLELRKDNLSNALTTFDKDNVVVIEDPRNLKEKLCDELIESGTVKGGEIINHSYTNASKNPNSRLTLEDYIETKNGIMPTLTTRCDTLGVVIGQPKLSIRKLTPKECFRLMAFDDEDHDKLERAGISNSQRYKMAGNSIVVRVLEKILKNLIETTL